MLPFGILLYWVSKRASCSYKVLFISKLGSVIVGSPLMSMTSWAMFLCHFLTALQYFPKSLKEVGAV